MPKDPEKAENQRDAGAEYGIPIAGIAPNQHGLTELWGAMRGTVLRYDDPFAPAVDPATWNAARDRD